MARDFDVRRRQRAEMDREFLLGGEKFVVRASVRPEALTDYEQITEETSTSDVLRVVDQLIVAMIEDGLDGHARYRALRERVEDPVSLDDLQEVVKWLMEMQTGRPTERPGDSSSGPGSTGTSSTDDSSSPPAEA